ncbi:nucleotidyltransferase family protein [Kineococcus sp. SYSU DK003]|uniref:nucleotidyltransferase family protein n=1 Tax=Kineococcus sp. SYSU DK003 TaxID=3383124 RepID=UPI003D7D2E57
MSVDAGVNVTASTPEQQRTALKRVAVALKESGAPFALAGGYAAWVHGAPEPVHDVDFVVARDDVEQVLDHLRTAGFRIEQPPEDWLVKVDTDGCLVDLLHRSAGAAVDRTLLSRAEGHEVLSVEMPVLSATDVVVAKLCAFDEHTCNFAPPLRVCRSIREAVDWDAVREQTADRPFARAFVYLLEQLDVVPQR